MPTLKRRIKQEITVDKICKGRLKSTECTVRGRAKDVVNVSPVYNLSAHQSGGDTYTQNARLIARSVPVFYEDKPLMPTTPSRARRWVKSGKATPFMRLGMFCIRLNARPSDTKTQPIVVGIDPGSKREGFTVKSKSKTYLNVLSGAVTWVKDSIESRKYMRMSRRSRTTPCRKNRKNRNRGNLPPSTKARWGIKLRIVNQLCKIYPITAFVVEDIRAKVGGRKWNLSFSPLQIGKHWFYEKLRKIGEVYAKQGHETAEMRKTLGLKKTNGKMEKVFSAHNVDSWVLAHSYVGGNDIPGNEEILEVNPIRFHRRQLHALCPTKNGKRRSYGGTVSLGFSRGSLIKNDKYGIAYVGGSDGSRLTLHDVKSGKRLCRNAKLIDVIFLANNKWRAQWVPLR